MKVKVISVFRDKYTGRVYNPAEVIEIEYKPRVGDLTGRGLVEVIEEKKEVEGVTLFEQEFEKKAVVDALKSIGAPAAMNMKEETILSKVAELDEEGTAKLKEALGIES